MIGAGAYYSFARSANVLVTDTDLHTNITTQYNDTELINAKYDVGMSAFVGYTIPVSKRSDFSVQLMYQKAFVDVNDNMNGYQRNQVFQLLFSFSLKN